MTRIRSSPGFRLRVAVGRITMGCECVLVWGQVSDLPDFERFLATDLDENVAAILPAGETHLRTLCKITESILVLPCFLCICPTANPTYLGTGVFAEVARVQMGHAARRFRRTRPLPRCGCSPQTALPRREPSDLLRRFHHRPMVAG